MRTIRAKQAKCTHLFCTTWPAWNNRKIHNLTQNSILVRRSRGSCRRTFLNSLISQRTKESLTIFGCLWEACDDFRYASMFCGSVQRSRYAIRTKHSKFRSAMAVSHYFCFWTACCQGIMDTLAKFENAALVDVYHCLCVDQYFSRCSLTTKNSTFLSSTASLCSSKFLSFSHDLTLPIVGSTFQLTGRHDLIGSSKYLQLPRAVRLPAVKLTSFLNFTPRHAVSRVANSNWRPDSVHVYWTCENVFQSLENIAENASFLKSNLYGEHSVFGI